MVRRQSNTRAQEVIKVSEWVPHIGLPSKVIPLKLFLDIVPSSSADITRALLKGSVYVVSFRFVSKQSKSSNAVGMSSLIVWLQARVFRLRYVLTHFETLIETTWDEMGGPHKFFVLISFLSRDVFCGSAVFFFDRASVFLCARLVVYYLAVYSVLGSLIERNLTATTTISMAV